MSACMLWVRVCVCVFAIRCHISLMCVCTRCVIIAGTPNFHGAKFRQYTVYVHKNFRAKAWDNAAWSATRIVHHMYCLYHVASLSTWRHCELDQRVTDTAVRQWRTRLRACIKAKGGHLTCNLVTLNCDTSRSFRVNVHNKSIGGFLSDLTSTVSNIVSDHIRDIWW